MTDQPTFTNCKFLFLLWWINREGGDGEGTGEGGWGYIRIQIGMIRPIRLGVDYTKKIYKCLLKLIQRYLELLSLDTHRRKVTGAQGTTNIHRKPHVHCDKLEKDRTCSATRTATEGDPESPL